MTVLILALAVNIEPVRIGLLPLLLSRDRPVLQLLAYLAGNLSFSTAFGLGVLFVFHENPFGTAASGGGKAQIGVGIAALLGAAFMAAREVVKRRRRVTAPPAEAPSRSRTSASVDRLTASVRRILAKSRSPWFAGLVGIGLSLPSIDYLAVLLVIATSGKPPAVQIGALVTTVVLSNLVIILPLIGHLLAPAGTARLFERFTGWARSRSTLEYAGLLALIGVLLILVGWSHL